MGDNVKLGASEEQTKQHQTCACKAKASAVQHLLQVGQSLQAGRLLLWLGLLLRLPACCQPLQTHIRVGSCLTHVILYAPYIRSMLDLTPRHPSWVLAFVPEGGVKCANCQQW